MSTQTQRSRERHGLRLFHGPTVRARRGDGKRKEQAWRGCAAVSGGDEVAGGGATEVEGALINGSGMSGDKRPIRSVRYALFLA